MDEDLKKCSKCKNILLKSNFHKSKNMCDGLYTQCKVCTKKYYLDNRDRIKEYQLKNGDRINTRTYEYFENRIEKDVNFRLIRNTRRRIHHALNGKSISSSTRDISGIDIDLYRKWIEYQFTPEMNWTNIELDHIKPICIIDVSNDEKLKEAFS